MEIALVASGVRNMILIIDGDAYQQDQQGDMGRWTYQNVGPNRYLQTLGGWLKDRPSFRLLGVAHIDTERAS